MSNIIVISGPSGSGKSTLLNRLVSEHEDIVFSISHTTRPKRENEVEGKHYFFVTKEKFNDMIRHGEFIEWAKVYQNFYGTSLQEIKSRAGGDRNLVLDLDIQGAKNIREKFPGALLIFIVPPNIVELKKRLIEREKAVNSHIESRLSTAKEELKQYGRYDYIIINDRLENAYAVLKSIYTAYNNSTAKKKHVIEDLLIEKG